MFDPLVPGYQPSPFWRIFRRRGVLAGGLWMGGLFGIATWFTDLGIENPPLHALVSVAVCLVLLFGFAFLMRSQAIDVPIRRLSDAERTALVAAVPPDRALLLVAVPRERLGFYRLDVYLDGRHLGQLKPGTGFALPILPGDRHLEVFVDTRRSREQAPFPALAGSRPGFRAHANVAKIAYVHLKPWTVLGEWAPGDLDGITLVRPLVSGI